MQKGNGDFMFAKGYGREFQQDVGETYVSGASLLSHGALPLEPG